MDVTGQLRAALAGRYIIDREIGAGGMATVYAARDVRHERRVALKVLRPELGAVLGAERFLSEIRVTANLQHPNLLPLFDSGESAGLLYYVMPYVEGESLRGRLEREKQLPIDEAIRIATSVASALDYAHRHGVIHRDLKPENILLHDGQPLIADFGIALAVSNAGGTRITQTGLSLGTPHYMSPEQATGDRAMDGRTDVYALGAVTYEMLSGEPPHSGTTAQAIIAKLLTEAPRPVTALRHTVPAYVDAAVRRALQKLPADRFATAREFAEALQGRALLPEPTGAVATPRSTQESESARWKRVSLLTGAIAVLALVATATAWLSRASTARSPQYRLSMDLPADARVVITQIGNSMVISPDGSTLVYVGGTRPTALYARRMDELVPHRLAGTEGATSPQFSPDGRWIAFVTGQTPPHLKKIPRDGGVPVTIADSVGRFAWGPGGTIVFSKNISQRGSALWVTNDAGAPPQRLTVVDSARDRAHASPAFMPDGKSVLFTIVITGLGRTELAAMRLAERRIIRLGIAGGAPMYADGILFFARSDGTLSGVRFDPKRLRVLSEPIPLLEDVAVKPAAVVADVALSTTGTLAYLSGVAGLELAEISRDGKIKTLRPELRLYRHPRVSPDGRRVTMIAGGDLWVYDIAASTMTRLTTNGFAGAPEWTRDGRRIAWTDVATDSAGVWWQPWDASAPPQRIVPMARGASMTPDNRYVITNVLEGTRIVLQAVPIGPDSGRKPIPLIQSTTVPQAHLSHDADWVAYSSDESGASEVYVQPFPGPGGKYQVSSGGGTEPVWSPNENELFYRHGSALIAVTYRASPQFSVVRRDTLFEFDAPAGDVQAAYDVFPDGKRFVFARMVSANSAPVIVTRWLDEVRERMKVAAPRK